MKERIESDLFYIKIMIDRLSRIEDYLQKQLRVGYNLNDDMVLDMLSFQLHQAGEQVALNKVSVETKEMFPDIGWAEMKKFRNFIAHSYNSKKNSVLIKIIQQDVPVYLERLNEVKYYLLKKMESETEN